MKKQRKLIPLILCLCMFLVSCELKSNQLENEPNPFPPKPQQGQFTSEKGDVEIDYRKSLSYEPTKAEHFDLVNENIQFTQPEIDLLNKNGFVISERLAWERFIDAYAWIYWKDLPVLITTDSILHTIHQSYNDMLQDIERAIIIPRLKKMLEISLQEIERQQRQNSDPGLEPGYSDNHIYFTVALALLNGEDANEHTPDVAYYINLARDADAIESIILFNNNRDIDFTIFTPRGHYTPLELSSADLETDKVAYDEPSYTLTNYFWAMSWLAQIDFRFVDYHPLSGEAIANPEAISSAMILKTALDNAGATENWHEINQIISTLVGISDNITLIGLDKFTKDLNINTPNDVFNLPAEDILAILQNNDYGLQRITSQIHLRNHSNSSDSSVNRPIAFMVFGSRFAVDSYVMSSLVYDQLYDESGSPIERPYPTSLDVAYALGNDHALSHLDNDLEKYGYNTQLTHLRQRVDEVETNFWTDSFYNQWLSLLRALSTSTTDEAFPEAMQTEIWADKMLQTQLASWAQLRHDNILYVKQSYTTQVLCEYPHGYVEPYSEFYLTLADIADKALILLEAIEIESTDERAVNTLSQATYYFINLKSIATQLWILSEKELKQEKFTEEETRFIKSIVIRQLVEVDLVCAMTVEEEWDGWYLDMFYDSDDDPMLVADVHTNVNNDMGHPELLPPGVLHVATGPINPIFLVVDTKDGERIYVGPSFSYYEFIEEGYPPNRLTDEVWRERLSSDRKPSPPEWTSSFKIPNPDSPDLLLLPTEP